MSLMTGYLMTKQPLYTFITITEESGVCVRVCERACDFKDGELKPFDGEMGMISVRVGLFTRLKSEVCCWELKECQSKAAV